MLSNAPHLPDVFKVAMSGRNNGHNLAPIQEVKEPCQMILPHSLFEVNGQMVLFSQEEEQDKDPPAPAGP